MNRENSRLLYAIFFTVVACLVVFAIALTIFGPQGFYLSSPQNQQSPIVRIPVAGNNIPVVETGVVINTGIISCTLDYSPVCGVNGQTYSNACTAKATGIVIANE